ncbi:Fic family protein [Corynebacterium uterequi]|uniref:Fic family protein n=1 Tax=Corynebacterium uterequi TaxID=1072256 RepID=UPI0009E3FEDE
MWNSTHSARCCRELYRAPLVNPNGLESAVYSTLFPPFSAAEDERLPVELAAALFYKISRGHFFLDGNKRTAWLVSVSFLREKE